MVNININWIWEYFILTFPSNEKNSKLTSPIKYVLPVFHAVCTNDAPVTSIFELPPPIREIKSWKVNGKGERRGGGRKGKWKGGNCWHGLTRNRTEGYNLQMLSDKWNGKSFKVKLSKVKYFKVKLFSSKSFPYRELWVRALRFWNSLIEILKCIVVGTVPNLMIYMMADSWNKNGTSHHK